MKIEQSRRTTASAASAAYARRAETASPRPVEEPGAVAGVMGIPESEFTPRVRDAIMALMQEVEALRRELGETKQRLADAEKDADQDHLLPLLNRRAFVRELTRAIAGAARYGTQASLVYFDLDGFKRVNDSFGHAAGDAVLTHFAKVLCEQVRDSDIVGRLGGDEFGIILSHAGEIQAHKKAEALSQILLASPAVWRDLAIPIDFSYGAVVLKAGEDANAAIANADAAMYAHKRDTRT